MPYTVLILDDEPEIVTLFSSLLQNLDFDCVPTTCPSEILQQKSFAFDIALLDFKMPKHNGVKVIEHIRAIDPNLPVIMMSAWFDKAKHNTSEQEFEVVNKSHVENVLECVKSARAILESKSELNRNLNQTPQSQAALMHLTEMAAYGTKASSIIHDILNMASVIRLYSGKLKKLEEKEKIDSVADKINDALTLITEICRDLKGIGKNQEKVTKSKYSVTNSVAEVVKTLEPICSDRNINLVFNPHQIEFHNHGNDLAFRRSILNILINAMQAIKIDSCGEIKVSVTKRNETFTICIEDSGTGIPDNIKTLIFERGFTTKGEKGTGLGLYSVRKNLEKENFSITLADKESTCFELTYMGNTQ